MNSPVNGIINLDKPAGLSSARAVGMVKRLLPKKTRIGHAGTLDPFATGVLVLLVGKSTKLCERMMSEPKQYEAAIKLGATTDTLDPESAETATPNAQPPALESILDVLPRFLGEIQQMPPAYSALKIGGRPAYKIARSGEIPLLEPRMVRVDAIEILRYEWPTLHLRIDCGRGTYIRSLARDIGKTLGMGGYLTELRRTRVGPFYASSACTIQQLQLEGASAHLSEYSH
jgi:tRNA pseudouridine55 synthase